MSTAALLVDALSARGQTVSFCESLTAGLAAATLADTPGASAVLRGGLITYATDLKSTLADVPREILESHGPVSEPTATAMAVGCRRVCGSDWAVALTGVAGPDPQDGHPVGEVWISFADSEAAQTERHHFRGDRWTIRKKSVDAALEGLLARMETK